MLKRLAYFASLRNCCVIVAYRVAREQAGMMILTSYPYLPERPPYAGTAGFDPFTINTRQPCNHLAHVLEGTSGLTDSVKTTV